MAAVTGLVSTNPDAMTPDPSAAAVIVAVAEGRTAGR